MPQAAMYLYSSWVDYNFLGQCTKKAKIKIGEGKKPQQIKELIEQII